MPPALKFGLFMPPFHALGQDPTLTYERDLELIERVDKLSFDEAWIGEHHSCDWKTIPSPELMIMVATSHTRYLRLGEAVVSLPFHHPFHMAERYAFLRSLEARPCNARHQSRSATRGWGYARLGPRPAAGHDGQGPGDDSPPVPQR